MDALRDVLRSRRRRGFVGRAAEIELFHDALTSHNSPFSVLYLCGPPGIGKTTLTDVLAGAAADRHATVVRLDGRDLVPSPSAVIEALRGMIDVPAGEAPIIEPPGRLVLVLDSYEKLAPLDDWLRTRLLPRLPASTLVVIACRETPAPGWRADPAWRELLRVISLRNLTPDECHEYLAGCGVPENAHARLAEIVHGHPLGLSLLADVVVRGGEVPADPLTPDLVGTLLSRLVDAVPERQRRRALEVCALARVTTEALLRDALGVEDAHEQFAWLRELAITEAGPDGLFPHDLARDTLQADLRWRDPDAYRDVFRRVRAHIHGRLRSAGSARDQARAISDLKFIFRNLPSVLSPVDWDAWGQHYPEPARDTDRAAIVEMVSAAEGDESASIAERWWDRQRDGFFVVRADDDAVRGVIVLLDLTRAADDDRTGDPGALAAWEHSQRHAPPRPGEAVTQTRFTIDREAYQGPSPTLNAVPVITLQRQLRMPNLACDYLALAEPERWDEFFAMADLPRAVGADFTVGGRRFGLYWHDFRQVPVDELVELWTERALAQEVPVPSPRPGPAVHVLSQPDFAEAVRQGLHDLHRPDLLARNPLLHTRLLHHRAGGGPPDAALLETLLREAADDLRRHPRDDKLWRAVDRTYIHGAATQEAAARVLDLPFSTYRRHLSQGVARIVAALWDREAYGPLPSHAEHK